MLAVTTGKWWEIISPFLLALHAHSLLHTWKMPPPCAGRARPKEAHPPRDIMNVDEHIGRAFCLRCDDERMGQDTNHAVSVVDGHNQSAYVNA